MRILTPTELPGLPAEVCALVADGVYALYELDENERGRFGQAVRYVLMTTQQAAYLLSNQGALIAEESRHTVEPRLGAPVTMNAPSQGTVRING